MSDKHKYLDSEENEISEGEFMKILLTNNVIYGYHGYKISKNTIQIATIEEILKLKDEEE